MPANKNTVEMFPKNGMEHEKQEDVNECTF